MNDEAIQSKLKSCNTHVIPVGGSEPDHIASGKCWCHPLAYGSVFRHNAKDCRDVHERIHGSLRSKDEIWVTVKEPVSV